MSGIIGPYRLEAPLGGGGEGLVWRASRPGAAHQDVAMKRVPGGAAVSLGGLRHEASVLAGLDHPHLVRLLDVVDDGDGIALVLQLAPGGSLDQLLHERGSLPPGEVVAVAAPLAEALAWAHRRGLIHGDLKPANVLFAADGEPLLADFGVARLIGCSVTSDHRIAGTAGYLAPELLDGTPAHPGSDLYALGVLCSEALTGRLPHEGTTAAAVLQAGRGAPISVAHHPGVPASLATVLQSAMARNPADRPATGDELARRLRVAVDARSIRLPGVASRPDILLPLANGAVTRDFGPAPPPPSPTPPAPASRRAMLLMMAVSAVGALVLVVRPAGDAREVASRCDEPAIEAAAGAQLATGDTTGRDCDSVAVYAQDGSAMVVTVRLRPPPSAPARYRLGQPGDRLLLGDWDCDGLDTAALYEPASGAVAYFDDWALEGGPSAPSRTAQLPPGVDAEVDTGAEGCDEVTAP